jgi:hypothetical protein
VCPLVFVFVFVLFLKSWKSHQSVLFTNCAEAAAAQGEIFQQLQASLPPEVQAKLQVRAVYITCALGTSSTYTPFLLVPVSLLFALYSSFLDF